MSKLVRCSLSKLLGSEGAAGSSRKVPSRYLWVEQRVGGPAANIVAEAVGVGGAVDGAAVMSDASSWGVPAASPARNSAHIGAPRLVWEGSHYRQVSGVAVGVLRLSSSFSVKPWWQIVGCC